MQNDRKEKRLIKQNYKNIYFSILYTFSFFLNTIYKIHYRVFRRKVTKIHIGCGGNYLPGFINIDGNFQHKLDYLLDIRVGLPFPNESIDFIYSCHMLEHVYIHEAINILKIWYKVLKPGGYVRLTLPDFNYSIKILQDKAAQSKFPRAFNSPSGQAINFLFCNGQHKYAFSYDMFIELSSQVGFSKIALADENDINIPTQLNEPNGSFSVNLYKEVLETCN